MKTVRIEGHGPFLWWYNFYKTYVDEHFVGQTLTKWGGRRKAKKHLFPRPLIVDEYELTEEGKRVK